jgi:hypothetical protein
MKIILNTQEISDAIADYVGKKGLIFGDVVVNIHATSSDNKIWAEVSKIEKV